MKGSNVRFCGNWRERMAGAIWWLFPISFQMRMWPTKSIARHDPMMENYKVTSNGRLFKEKAEYEHVPEEERPGYDEEIGGFENEVERGRGSRKKIHQGWSDTEYHGIFEFHRTIDGDYVSLDAKFTDGQLVEITPND